MTETTLDFRDVYELPDELLEFSTMRCAAA